MPQQGKRNADDKLLLALACGASVEVAAQQAGISATTAYRRLDQPEFKTRLRQIRSDIVQRTAGALTAAATESVRTLLELQKPPNPPATRLGAARSVLEIGLKIREVVELETQMADLEAKMRRIEQDRPAPQS